MDDLEVVEKRSRRLIYKKNRLVFYHKRWNTAHNKIQEKKEFNVVLAKVLLEKLNEVVRTI
jgi:hypothetical protein